MYNQVFFIAKNKFSVTIDKNLLPMRKYLVFLVLVTGALFLSKHTRAYYKEKVPLAYSKDFLVKDSYTVTVKQTTCRLFSKHKKKHHHWHHHSSHKKSSTQYTMSSHPP